MHATESEISVVQRQRKSASLSKPELDYDQFITIACGHTAARLLWAGVELDLFTLLSRRPNLTREVIAQELQLQQQPARILLQGLTALRLIHKIEETYRNSEIADRLLVRGKPGSYIPLLGWQQHIVYKGLLDFTESLKRNTNVGLRQFPGTGASLYERLTSDPVVEGIFQDAMSALSNQANAALAAVVDLRDVKHVCDLGGGDGTNAINLVQRFPGLKATVLDSKTVTTLAQDKIADAGLSNRVFTHIGDFLTEELPAGIDCFLLCHIMTIWSAERNIALLKKCHTALPRGGKVMIFNMVSNDDETGPLINALGSPYFQAIATGEGMLYCFKDYEAWLREAGFRKITRTGLPMEHVLFVAEK